MKILIATGLLLFSTYGMAAACSYNEAIMALQQGNQQRALVMLEMAARDGDSRAAVKLAELAQPVLGVEPVLIVGNVSSD